jgi:cation diffusion facilitator CzcD-associated flavoprotein CzcO
MSGIREESNYSGGFYARVRWPHCTDTSRSSAAVSAGSAQRSVSNRITSTTSSSSSGRRVAVIGTGGSAVQFIPEIQKQVEKLHVFRRTPAWVMPRPDAAIPEWRRRMYRRMPITQRAVRLLIYAYREAWVVLFRNPGLMRRARQIATRHLQNCVRDPSEKEKRSEHGY